MNKEIREPKTKKGSRKLKPDQNGATSVDGTLGKRARKRLGVVVVYLSFALLLFFLLKLFFQ